MKSYKYIDDILKVFDEMPRQIKVVNDQLLSIM